MNPVDLDDVFPPDGLREALLGFYDAHARTLPWRGEADPYRVLVSEVMLQQTRVETVKRYYEPWLERFPDVRALARADEEDVLKAWEGLGYYRRARNLHRAARAVHEGLDGCFPDEARGLRELPGVGEYTAGAVASIAFGRAEPAVDGNVRRVLARLLDVARPPLSLLRRAATALVDPHRPGDWNQAMMELGATVCTPRSPACERCPVAAWCRARAAGTVAERPAPVERPTVDTRRFVVGLFESDARLLFVKRPEEGLLGGMWAFPEAPAAPAMASTGREKGAAPPELLELASAFGLPRAADARPLPLREHRFTHLHAVYEPWWLRVEHVTPLRDTASRPGQSRDGASSRTWATAAEASALALPVAQRWILERWEHLR